MATRRGRRRRENPEGRETRREVPTSSPSLGEPSAVEPHRSPSPDVRTGAEGAREDQQPLRTEAARMTVEIRRETEASSGVCEPAGDTVTTPQQSSAFEPETHGDNPLWREGQGGADQRRQAVSGRGLEGVVVQIAGSASPAARPPERTTMSSRCGNVCEEGSCLPELSSEESAVVGRRCPQTGSDYPSVFPGVSSPKLVHWVKVIVAVDVC